MNTNTLLKTIATTALFSAVFFGFATVNTDMSLLGVTVSYVAALAIFGLAAFDGVKRTS